MLFRSVDPIADLTNPNVVRASQGTLFSMPIAQTTSRELHAWLRTHAALVVGMMSVGVRAHATGRGVSWQEAALAADATRAAFALVRALGHPLLPGSIAALARLPRVVWTAALYAGSRTRLLRDLGALGPHEPRMLIDQMLPSASTSTATLFTALRP